MLQPEAINPIRVFDRKSFRVCTGFCVFLALFAALPRLVAADETAAMEKRLLDAVTFLASDQCEGRAAGSVGIELAADFVAQQFQAIGLKTDFVDGGPFQPFSVDARAEVGSSTQLTLLGPPGEDGKEPAAIKLKLHEEFSPIGGGNSADFEVPIVFVGFGITGEKENYDDYADMDVKGKAVVILRHEPEQGDPNSVFKGTKPSDHATFRRKIANAREHGAACVIFVNDAFDLRKTLGQIRQNWQKALDELAAEHERFKTVKNPTLQEIKTQHERIQELTNQVNKLNETLAGRFDPVLPLGAAGGIRSDSNIPILQCRREVIDPLLKDVAETDLAAVEREIDEGPKPKSFDLKGWRVAGRVEIKREKHTVKNVIGMLEGEGPHADEAVVIGAHYDHVGVRKGSGGKMEVYNGADDNASGTSAMIEIARMLASRDKKLGRDVLFVAFTAEERGLLGSRHYVEHPLVPLDNTVAMINLDMVGRLRSNVLNVHGTGTGTGFDQLLDPLGGRHELDLKKRPSGFGPSDHASFCRKNIPVLFFITGFHSDLHKPTDDVEKINVPGMRRVCQLVGEVAAELADLDERPKFQTVPTEKSGRRSYLGVTPASDQSGGGFTVGDVLKDGPAEKAGLKKDDVIVQIGDAKISGLQDVMTELQKHKGGDRLSVKIRRGNEDVTLEVTLGTP